MLARNIKREFKAEMQGNKVLKAIVPEVQKILEPMLNKKVTLKDGLLIKKVDTQFKAKLEQIKEMFNNYNSNKEDSFRIHMCYIKEGYSRFELKLSLCFSEGNNTSCYYKEFYFIVGSIDDDVLKSINYDDSVIEQKLSQKYVIIISNMNKASKLIKQAEELQKGMPHYARLQLPYVG